MVKMTKMAKMPKMAEMTKMAKMVIVAKIAKKAIMVKAKKTGHWNGHSWEIFSSQKLEGMSKFGNNIICISGKNNHFLFYAQECGAKFEPATPS